MSMKIDEQERGIPFEMTNACTCANYYEEGEQVEFAYCLGFCWDEQVEDFIENCVKELFNNSQTSWWKVTGLNLWNGNYDGIFHADDVFELITGMTVNSEWIMRGTAYSDRIEYSLSHHDSMGSNTMLTNISEEERQELGLY